MSETRDTRVSEQSLTTNFLFVSFFYSYSWFVWKGKEPDVVVVFGGPDTGWEFISSGIRQLYERDYNTVIVDYRLKDGTR